MVSYLSVFMLYEPGCAVYNNYYIFFIVFVLPENRNGSGPAAIQSHDTREIDINDVFYKAGFSKQPEDEVFNLLGRAGLGNIRLVSLVMI